MEILGLILLYGIKGTKKYCPKEVNKVSFFPFIINIPVMFEAASLFSCEILLIISPLKIKFSEIHQKNFKIENLLRLGKY